MPSNYQSKSIEGSKRGLTDAELAERANLVVLIGDYELVRKKRGPEHNEAERLLGEALEKYVGPFRYDGHIWQWSRTQLSILRHEAVKFTQCRGK